MAPVADRHVVSVSMSLYIDYQKMKQQEISAVTKKVRDFVTADSIVDSDSLLVTADGRYAYVSMSLNVACEIKQNKMTQKIGMLKCKLWDVLEGVLAKLADVDSSAVSLSISKDPSGSKSKVKVDAQIQTPSLSIDIIERLNAMCRKLWIQCPRKRCRNQESKHTRSKISSQ